MTTALEVKNINKKYKNKVVLNDINFSIQSGEIVALIGKNGAGKSTLINIITKLIQQDSGQSKIFEKEKFDKNLIGVMMQENISLDRITVKEIIKLTRTYYRNPMSYQAILALSELQNYTNHPMDKLSGGQKRKLQFALTLAGNPDLIFLDEPTVGMDAESRTKFWKHVDELKKQGKTFLITSHYLEELEKVANRFIFLHNQKIIFDGSLNEMGKQLKKVQVTFNSELIEDIFNKLPAVLRVSELNHHYTLITSDVNRLITQLVPYLSAIDNLEIRQQNLDTLMDSLIRNEE
ncbi:ABC transporter ATP-binding protein [Lactobacillus salivarius]|jgi:ABC-2 type transport system ATP-binding protein|uniref:ABC transporter ATP-binding protein n=2 Tax=Ligilactobacillus salivarius TaxID=1624 RepID=A0ABD6JA46_9LACO|nr:ABC transporter ATP-binding protein [Ligilactobacillus salivarius]ADJ79810.1 ABC transporter, ATP-binding protein [Ligilactobacillus salivarius CECT 5713]AKI05281.1 ABC transporter ATP-binding protein [Ligilactobacillus salivarius str. Ren]MDE1498835.1 ABC transporter ATP-binding protein [Ligilactobacillus salivarius]MDE1523647.1 ABC transporter ATP-binding protein [Ligilactobacillus salivarius]MYU38830.1 ABC transporter ATP-binding protein [Ligilactobacillus salivarius]